jgi:hypothetical protein
MCSTIRQKCPSSGCQRSLQVRCGRHFGQSVRSPSQLPCAGVAFKRDVRDTLVKVSVVRHSLTKAAPSKQPELSKTQKTNMSHRKGKRLPSAHEYGAKSALPLGPRPASHASGSSGNTIHISTLLSSRLSRPQSCPTEGVQSIMKAPHPHVEAASSILPGCT